MTLLAFYVLFLSSSVSGFHPSPPTPTTRPHAVNRGRGRRSTTHHPLAAVEDDDGVVASGLDPAETALVLIEYQNEFATPGGKLHDAVRDCMESTNMLQNSARLTRTAREAGCTIMHCPIAFEPGHAEISSLPYGILKGVKDGSAFVSGEWGAEICSEMRPEAGDLMVKGKSGLCGFVSTNMDFLLRQNNIKNVVLGGFLTNCCVESTMRSAYELGYKVYTLTDCVAATSVEAQDATLRHNFGMFSFPTTSDEVARALQKTTR